MDSRVPGNITWVWEVDSWSPICPHPKSWNLWICYITWQKGVTDRIKVRIWRWRAYPTLSRWAQYNHRGPYKGKRQKSQEKEMGQQRERSERCRAISQGIWAAFKSWKRSREHISRKHILPYSLVSRRNEI